MKVAPARRALQGKPGLVVETTAGRRWLYTQNQLPGSSETPVTFMRAF